MFVFYEVYIHFDSYRGPISKMSSLHIYCSLIFEDLLLWEVVEVFRIPVMLLVVYAYIFNSRILVKMHILLF